MGVAGGDRPFTTGQPISTEQPSPPVVAPAPGTGAGNPPGSPEPKSGVLGVKETLATLPPPVLGKSANVAPVSGIVYIELPPGATLASSHRSRFGAPSVRRAHQGLGFMPLTEARQIPVGSILDTTAGVVSITTATTASSKGEAAVRGFRGWALQAVAEP